MALSCLSVGGCASPRGTVQQLDLSWQPVVETPAHGPGRGPTVLVDAAHGNYHTIDGRYGAFARLLEADGHIVRSAETPVTQMLLDDADVFVISNALKGGADAEWKLPTPSAFRPEEIETLVRWVEGGGALMLIADHMPMPGATADLAAAFGIVFYNGFAMKSVEERGTVDFSRAGDTLADHAITRGRHDGERVNSVRSFTGQAFRAVAPVEALMHLPRRHGGVAAAGGVGILGRHAPGVGAGAPAGGGPAPRGRAGGGVRRGGDVHRADPAARRPDSLHGHESPRRSGESAIRTQRHALADGGARRVASGDSPGGGVHQSRSILWYSAGVHPVCFLKTWQKCA